MSLLRQYFCCFRLELKCLCMYIPWKILEKYFTTTSWPSMHDDDDGDSNAGSKLTLLF
jgi:hypothetical protein